MDNIKTTHMPNQTISEQIISFEKETLQAFKAKDVDKFTQYFSNDYVGVANDGIKTASDEVTGMKKLTLTGLSMSDEKTIERNEDTVVITYKMNVEGTLSGKDISGPIYCSTLYVKEEGSWRAVLHTESLGTKA